MYHRHMRDASVSVKNPRNLPGTRYFIKIFFIQSIINACVLCNRNHPFAIRTVRRNQKLLFFSDHTGQNGFHTECPAALHKNSRVFLFGNMSKIQKFPADLLGDLFVIVIPCAMVKKHLLFYCFGCSERSRCK